MKFIVMGGDGRFARLCSLLEREGHGVFPLFLEKALPVQGPPDFEGADCVLLPLPAEREGRLNAPLSGEKPPLPELLFPLRPGTVVLAGMAGRELREFCRRSGLKLRDYFEREELQVKNALLTAEGAQKLLMERSGRGLRGQRVLISGFGRIGRLLAPRLLSMGAGVSVAARSAADRAWAEAMGCTPLSLGNAAGEYDFVVNTVPAQIFGREEMENFGGAELIELASAPYGFDMAAAKELEREIVLAPGLPAVYAPAAAAEAIRDTILNILEE